MYERAMFVARTFKVKTGRDRAFLATEKYMSEKTVRLGGVSVGKQSESPF